MTHTKTLVISAAFLFLLALLFYVSGLATRSAEASVAVSNDYMSTTTAASNAYGATISTTKVIRTGNGTLGSVVITGAASGVVNLYNATTTDVSKRTNNVATTSILLASLPASLAAGTYTFDVRFTDGLLIDIASGNMPTSTITYR